MGIDIEAGQGKRGEWGKRGKSEKGGKHTHTHTHGLTLGVKLAVLVPYVGVICVAKGCFLCARR